MVTPPAGITMPGLEKVVVDEGAEVAVTPVIADEAVDDDDCVGVECVGNGEFELMEEAVEGRG